MSESQSRYSIVERLTTKKLDLMSAKLRLKEDVKKAEQFAKTNALQSVSKIEDIQAEADRQKRDIEADVRAMKQRHKNLEEQQSEKENMYDEKIRAINEALSKIEEISKSQS